MKEMHIADVNKTKFLMKIKFAYCIEYPNLKLIQLE